MSYSVKYWSNALKGLCRVLQQTDVFIIISKIFYSANYKWGLVGWGGCAFQTFRNVSLNRLDLKIHIAEVSKLITWQQMFSGSVSGCSVVNCFPLRQIGNSWSSLSEPLLPSPTPALPRVHSLPLMTGTHNTGKCDPISKQLKYLA